MKNYSIKIYLLALALFLVTPAFSQCDILQRLAPGGSIWFYLEPNIFYFTELKSLKGNVVTDKENYFIAIRPKPFPDKAQGKKIKEPMIVTLGNGKFYKLTYFDSRYLNDNSEMEITYMIDKNDLEAFLNFEVKDVTIDIKEEGLRKYVFKLHKSAIRDQLNCFMDSSKK